MSISLIQKIITPEILKNQLPLSPQEQEEISNHRKEIQEIIQ
jgi:phospho-2-dehydro-3-deoxyheptonate aldolase